MKRLIFALILLLTSAALPSVASEEDSVSSTSISFGASFPLTGAASPGISSYYSGIDAYFSYVNANGGIYGKKINLIKNLQVLKAINKMN
jgi:ABC-type branched-subunit amino acid transport system substrate-binding protein